MSEIRVTDIKGEDGSAAVNFSKGINISSGVCTATTFSGSGSGLTGLTASQIPNLNASKITAGTLPTTRGGTGLTSLGSAGKALKVNSAGNALEFGDAGIWTKIGSGTGPSSSSTSITLDNIFSDTYDLYKIYFIYAQDDWVLVRYIAADGSIRTGNNYSWVGGQVKHNADVHGRYNDRSDDHAVYNYWDGQDNAWHITETLFADPYASTKRTTEVYTAMCPNGSQTTVAQHGANQYQSAESHRGIQIFGNSGDSLTNTNFRYIILGLSTT